MHSRPRPIISASATVSIAGSNCGTSFGRTLNDCVASVPMSMASRAANLLSRSAAVRTHVRDALLSRAAPLVLALDVSHESPTLRFPFSLAAHHLIVAAPGSAADAEGAAGGSEDVARVNVTVLAVSADEQGRVAMNVSVWGREGLGLAHSLGASGSSGEDSREVLLATDVGVALRGGGVHRGDGAAGGRDGGKVEDKGRREEAGAQESEAEAEAEYEYAATTEALFCRPVELSLQDLLPPWLSFLSSGAWGGRGGLRAGERRAGALSGPARWEKVKVGGSEWGVTCGFSSWLERSGVEAGLWRSPFTCAPWTEAAWARAAQERAMRAWARCKPWIGWW